MSKVQRPSQRIYTSIVFQAPQSTTTVEIIGVPGRETLDGQCIINEIIERFFDDCIAKPIFKANSRFNQDFSSFKIWLYDTEENLDHQSYVIPSLAHSVGIPASVPNSMLNVIHILSRDISDFDNRSWRRSVEAIGHSLFKSLAVLHEVPCSSSAIPENPFYRLQRFLESRDPYTEMKQELFFDALIVQID
jgi:hypothetical protein